MAVIARLKGNTDRVILVYSAPLEIEKPPVRKPEV